MTGTRGGGAQWGRKSKLTDRDVAKIKALAGDVSSEDLARRFGVSGSTVRHILSEKPECARTE